MQNCNSDNKKICFIICSNDQDYLEECIFYINQLEIPLGYKVDIISVHDAVCMTGGYNEGMCATDAKYKIYLHQDVFILYKGFLKSILDIFQSDSSIGMIGMVGAPKMPVGAVMWYGHREGELYEVNDIKDEYQSYQYKLEDGLHEVEAVDGLLMATCIDIPWREDLFDGWDFYDVSQSFEFIKAGYRVVVPEQNCPWCTHDDGVLNLLNYDKYRKICMKEYPEFFYRDRFVINKHKKIRDTAKRYHNLCVVIIARNQFKLVKNVIQSIKLFADIEENQIVIVDNGSEDGLRHWLKREGKYNFIICEEIIENYSSILNKVIENFIEDEDIFLLSSNVMLMPGCLENLYQVLEKNKNTGVVSAKNILNTSKEGESAGSAWNYIQSVEIEKKEMEILGLPSDGTLIKNEMLKTLDRFDDKLVLPESNMMDFSFRGIKKGYHFYEVQDAFLYRIYTVGNDYYDRFGANVDRAVLKEKWEMNYFNQYPNYRMLSCIDEEKEKDFSVLEIGCDCGVNLLHLKNCYPNVRLYGAELNPGAVKIASHIANVKEADIEDKALDFSGIKFDYIIFGDVLEHLRNPQAVIEYCKELLSEDGRILACIPNLMHYSVMRELVKGNFTYTDMGLLDKTHIHFFTYNEIIRLFTNTGYQIESMIYVGSQNGISKEDVEFVNHLVNLSGGSKEFMYYAFQYIVMAKYTENY